MYNKNYQILKFESDQEANKTKNLVLWPREYKNQLYHLVKKIHLVTEVREKSQYDLLNIDIYRFTTAKYDQAQPKTTKYVQVYPSTVQYGPVRSSTVQYGPVRSSTVQYGPVRSSTT